MELADKKGNFKVAREEWIAVARKTLIEEGIAGVKVERLAARLGVTRGGFYWFFKSRADLLDQLLHDWETTNTEPFFTAAKEAGPDGVRQLEALSDVWIAEKDYSPAYDSAVRDWARTSPKVRKVVERVDKRRIDLLTGICRAMGYEGDEAFIRARIIYFHQIGYYSLNVHEAEATRRRYLPLYTRILSGR